MYDKGIWIDHNFVIYNRSGKKQKFSFKGATFCVPHTDETLSYEKAALFIEEHEIDKKVLFYIEKDYFRTVYGRANHRSIELDYLFKEVPEIIVIEDFINKKFAFPERYKVYK